MTAVPPRYASALLVVLVLALGVVARFTWAPPRIDDCASPSSLMDPAFVGGDHAPRREGEPPPDRIAGVVTRGEHSLAFRILRSFGLPGFLQRPTTAFADHREPNYVDRASIRVGASTLPINFMYEEADAVRITAYLLVHGPDPIASPFLARVLNAPRALVQGAHPITLIAISGIAQPNGIDRMKSLLEGWIADTWEHYQRACRS